MALGPHHGGRLSRIGAPPTGNPGHPRRGAAATSAVATPASPPPHARPRDPGGRDGGWGGRGARAAQAERRAAAPSTGVERGGRLESPGAEAALPSGMRRRGRRAPFGGGRRQGAEPRLRTAAARFCQSPAHHLPPRRRLPAQSPGGDRGASQEHAEPGEGPHGGGFLQTRSSRDVSGRRRRWGASGPGPASHRPHPGRRRAGEPEGRVPRSGGAQGERPQLPYQPLPTSSSAGQLLTPARGEPRGGRRKRSRRALLPPPPPLPEPGAPTGERDEVVPGDFPGRRLPPGA